MEFWYACVVTGSMAVTLIDHEIVKNMTISHCACAICLYNWQSIELVYYMYILYKCCKREVQMDKIAKLLIYITSLLHTYFYYFINNLLWYSYHHIHSYLIFYSKLLQKSRYELNKDKWLHPCRLYHEVEVYTWFTYEVPN